MSDPVTPGRPDPVSADEQLTDAAPASPASAPADPTDTADAPRLSRLEGKRHNDGVL